MKKSLIIAAAVVVFSSSAMAQEAPQCAGHATQSNGSEASQPYAGEETLVVNSLSSDDANALRSGAGMGLAKAAELNHYPGPKHVMEHSADLGMSAQQVADTKRAFDAMKDDAVRLGVEIVAKEEALDRLFASGKALEEGVARATAEIASLQGRLRATHLTAHLRMREIMTPEQIAAYDTLRGYRNQASPRTATPALSSPSPTQ